MRLGTRTQLRRFARSSATARRPFAVGRKLTAERLEDRSLLAVLFAHDGDDPVGAIAPSEAAYNNFGLDWIGGSEPFDDSTWARTSGAPNGVGYDRGAAYDALLGLDLEASMYAARSTMFVRAAFDVDDPVAVDRLTLNLRYDDGFIAWLNGVEVARANADTIYPEWNATATAEHQASTTAFDTFDLAAFIGSLRTGTNILAVRGLNLNAADDDALIQFTLTGESRTGPPLAVDDTAATDEGVPVTIDVLANDQEGSGTINPASVAIASPPTHGTAVANANGTITYTPNPVYNGPDTFTYTVRDNIGVGQPTQQTLVAATAPARALVPANNNLGDSWRGGNEPFNDSAWQSGTLGAGFEQASGYEPYLGLNVGPAMYNVNTSVYVRSTFTLGNPADVTALTLRMRYDDGFAAFLNGVRVASANAAGELAYNSAATAENSDINAVVFQSFDITSFASALRPGPNVLAIHGLNFVANSSDMLVQPELTATLHPRGQESNAATVTVNITGIDYPPIARDDNYEVEEGETLIVDDTTSSGEGVVPGPGQYLWDIAAGGNGHVYERVAQSTTWPQARAAAQSRSLGGTPGHLVTITSAAELAFVRSVLPSESAWIGGYQDTTAPDYSEPAGGWRWVTGEPWAYTNWAAVEPNDQGGENAVHIVSDGQWNDIRENYEWGAFWVEYPVTGISRTELLVPSGATWSYRDNGVLPPNDSQGNTWKDRLYDDATWASGPAQLGYGDNDEATRVNCGPSAPACNSNNHITTWFRRRFTLEPGQARAAQSLLVELLRDDAAAVYINGVEVARDGLPGALGDGTITPETLAVGTSSETAFFPHTVDLSLPRYANLLRDGENVIAVEIHQVNSISSDVSFDQRLSATLRVATSLLANDTEPDEQPMTAVLETLPANGALDLEPDGTFTYTPNPGFVGVDTFTYRASDGLLTSEPATVSITVIHAAPTALPDSYATDESTPLVVAAAQGVLANDTDTQGHSLTASVVASPANGSLALNADGSFTYTPTPGYHGTDTFTYTANDGLRNSDPATVTITINSINTPPVAVDDVFSVREGFTLDTVQLGTLKVFNTGYDEASGTKLANNATDADFVIGPGSATGVGTSVRAAGSGLPSSYLGDSSSAASSWITMAALDQPAGVFFFDTTVVLPGGDASSVRLSNLRYATDNKLVSIFVNSMEVFTQPVGDAEEFRNFQTLGNLGVGAFRPGANTIRFEVYNGGGALALRVEGVVDYDPNAAPDVLANDSDVDSTALTARILSEPEHGALEFNANGTFRYTPNAGFVGIDTFTYVANDGESDSNVATVTINVLHAPPTATADAYAIAEDGTLDVPAATGVLANDTDTQNHPLTATLVAGPANGSLNLRADGSFTYSPNQNYHGTDSFTYRASDGALSSQPATVTITIASVNDAPTAGDDAYQTFANAPLTVPTTPVYVKNIATGLVNATLAKQANLAPDDDYRIGAGSAGHVGATPVARQSGFGPYLADAASAGSRWLIFDDAPEGTHYFDIQVDLTGYAASQAFVRGLRFVADNRLASIAVNGIVVFSQPTAGSDEMSAWRTLGDVGLGAFRPGTNTIRFGVYNAPVVAGINPLALRVEGVVVAPPIATDPLAALDAGLVQHWKFDETTGDTAEDAKGSNDLTLFNWTAQETKWTSGRIGGALAFDGNNSYAISAAPIALPRYSFSFWLRVDARTGINPRILGPANDHWVLQNNQYSRGIGFYYENGGSLAQDPTEPLLGQWEHYVVTYERALSSVVVYRNGVRVGSGNAPRSQPTSALWVLGHNGDANNHTDSLNGRLDDVRIYDRILPPAEAALLAGLDTFADPGFLANDGDADADPVTVVLASLPANGALAPGRPGAFTYTPNPGFVGTDSFTYRLSDGQTLSNVATVTIEVLASSPISVGDAYTLNEDGELDVAASAGVLANDTDALARPLFAALVAGPAYGLLMLDADGGFRYTPDENFFGEDSFVYRAMAGEDASSDTIVRLTITSVNDAPVADGDEFTIDRGTTLVLTTVADTPETIARTSFAVPPTGAVNFVAAGGELGFMAATSPAATELGVTADDQFIVRGNSSMFALNFDPVSLAEHQGVRVQLDLRSFEDSAGFEPDDFFRATLGLSRIGGPIVSQTLVNLSGSQLKALDRGPNGAFTTFSANIPDGFLAVTLSIETSVNSSTERVFFDNIVFTGFRPNARNLLLDNDSDADGDALTVRIVTPPAHGTLATDSQGAMRYTPDPLFVGVDTFTYVASDGQADSNAATATIRVAQANLVPIANDDGYATQEDQPLVVPASQGLLANDTDLDDDVLAVSIVAPPQHGALSIMPDGSFTYTPAENYYGSDSFSYVANDGFADSSVAAVTIAIAAVNDAPIAVDDAYTLAQGDVLNAAPPTYRQSILASSPLAYWRLGETTGPLALDLTGRFPGAYTGGVSRGESGAIAADADAATRFDGATAYVRVPYDAALNLANNFSVEAWIKPNAIAGQSIILGNHAGPAGYAVGIFEGRLTFTTYGILDYRTQPVVQVGQWHHIAVTFDASNDATFYLNGQFLETVAGSSAANSSNNPLFLGATPNVAGTAPFEAYNGVLDEVAIYGRVLEPVEILAHYAAGTGQASVPEQETLFPLKSTWRYRDDIANGSAYPADSQGDLWTEHDYDDSAWPSGPALLGYEVIEAAPVATTIGFGPNANDKYRTALFRRTFEVESAARTVALSFAALFDDGAAVYINGREIWRHNLPGVVGDATLRTDTLAPIAGNESNYVTFFTQLDAFPGLLVDGANTIAVEVHQTTANSSDLGFDLSLVATVLPDPVASGVLGNDTDVEQDPLAAELVSGPQHGSLNLNPDGTFIYTPAAGFHGNDSFTYRAFDGADYSNVATVHIVVTRRLIAVDDAYAIAEDTFLSAPRLQGVLANDPEGGDPAIAAVIASAPANGTVSLAPNGAFLYRPNANFAGTDTFTYRLTDGIIASDPATVTIMMSAVNDAPTTQRDVYATGVGETLTTSLNAGADYADIVADGGAVVHWRLDEAAGTTAADIRGARHGTYLGQPTLGQSGAILFAANTSVDFDGIDDYVEVPYTAAVNVTASYSIEVWAMVQGRQLSDRSVVTSRNSVGGPNRTGYMIYAGDTDRWEFWTGGGPGANWDELRGPDIVTGQWAHLVATFEVTSVGAGVVSGTKRLFVNGELAVSRTNVPYLANGAAPLRIGAGVTEGAPQFFFDGKIDEVAFYQRALDAEEIAMHHNAGRGQLIGVRLADSVAEFSGNQGQDGWFYGYYNRTTDGDGVYQQSEFIPFPRAPGAWSATNYWDPASNWWRWFGSIPPWTIMTAAEAHPNGTNSGPEHWAIRRWVSDTAGPVVLSGHLAKTNTNGGDGVRGMIYVDGQIVYDRVIGATDAVGVNYEINATLAVGSIVDFVLTPNGGDFADGTRYTATIRAGSVQTTTVDLLARNSIWRYRDAIVNGSPYPIDAQGDLWREANYDDTAWFSGPAILGYGGIDAGPTRTTIRVGPDGGGVSRTALFRRTFDLTVATERIAAITIEGVFDDGAAVYVNGREILRYNLPGALGDSTLRTDTLTLQTGNESSYTTFVIDLAAFPNLLVVGANTIAVEVHQVNDQSSDLGFDLSLSATLLPDPAAGGVLGNDSDAEGDDITAALVAGPYHGTLFVAADGTFTYTPNPGFEGVDRFTYRASDGVAESATTLVTINVGDTNEAPLAFDDRFVAKGGATLTVTAAKGVLANDFDANGDALAATVFAQPARGTLALAADGGFVYTPQAGFLGVDSFTYRVADESGTFGFATATIHVVPQLDPINGVPTASNDVVTAPAGAVLGVLAPGVLANDSDPEQRPLFAVVERPPWHGSLSFGSDGSFTYTPRPGFLGEDSFTYRASDGNTFSPPATVTLGVAPAVIHGGVALPTLPEATLPGSTLPNSMSPGTLPAIADINGDGRVDLADLAAVVAAYGSTSGPLALHAADVNRDGQVSILDALAVRNAFGQLSPTSHVADSLTEIAAPRVLERIALSRLPDRVTALRLPARTADRAVVAAIRTQAETPRRPPTASAVDAALSVALDQTQLTAAPSRSPHAGRVRTR